MSVLQYSSLDLEKNDKRIENYNRSVLSTSQIDLDQEIINYHNNLLKPLKSKTNILAYLIKELVNEDKASNSRDINFKSLTDSINYLDNKEILNIVLNHTLKESKDNPKQLKAFVEEYRNILLEYIKDLAVKANGLNNENIEKLNTMTEIVNNLVETTSILDQQFQSS